MEDWKYLRKLHLTEKHGILKGVAIAVFVLTLAGLVCYVVKCVMNKNCACLACRDDYDDEADDDDFEEDDE